MITFPKYESYKDCEIPGIEQIPAHWQVRKLKHIAKVRLSNVDKHSKSNEKPICLCNYTDVYYQDFITESLDFMEATATGDQITNFSLIKGDVLITKDSESADDIAVPAYVSETLSGVICGYHLAHIKPYGIEGAYLFRAFQSEGITDQFRISANGITRFGIGKSSISGALFLVPSREEQKRIVEFLDRKTAEIDEAISYKQRLIELLQEQKAILINRAVTQGLNPNAPMRDSGVNWLGPIPQHWEIRRLKHLFIEVDDRSVDGSETLLSLRMNEGLIPHDEVSDKPIEDSALVGYKRVRPGEMVMNRMRAAIGLFGVATILGIVSPDYAIFKKRESLEIDYYLSLFKTDALKTVFLLESKGIGTGSQGFLRLYSDRFGMIKVPFPPLEEQREILKYIQKVEEEFSVGTNQIIKEIQLLQELRSLFIAKAVAGKIKV